MGAAYDLWDLDSGNRLATYHAEAEALAAVRDLVDAHPGVYGDSLSLVFYAGPGHSRPIAQGAELVRFAREVGARSH